jgi:hypothetical protein
MTAFGEASSPMWKGGLMKVTLEIPDDLFRAPNKSWLRDVGEGLVPSLALKGRNLSSLGC